MKEFLNTGRKALDANQPSPTRRKLLKACAYLPTAPLLAMLGGCDREDPTPAPTSESTFVPSTQSNKTTTGTSTNQPLEINLPPYKQTDPVDFPLQKLPERVDGPIEVTRGSAELVFTQREKRLMIPQRMNVGIYNLEYNSFKQIAARRSWPTPEPNTIKVAGKTSKSGVTADRYYETIKAYLKRALDNRFALMYRAMMTAFEKQPPIGFDVSFFTAPEFYWNVPWGEFLNEDEVKAVGDIFIDTVTSHAKKLIAKFPVEKYGQIILLPGSVAALKPDTEASKINDSPFTMGSGTIYDAFNYLVCTHNLALNDPWRKRPAYMIWPKRVVSSIDFKDGPGCTYRVENLKPKKSHPMAGSVEECILSRAHGLTVYISYVTSSTAKSFDADGKKLSDTFQNDIVLGLPFGIDICLDYMEASVQQDEHRMAQLDERKFKLDFVIAAGISLDLNNYANAPYIQYAIHNDGILWSSESFERGGNLYSTIWKLIYDKDKKTIDKEVPAPIGADSTFDTVKGVITIDSTKGSGGVTDADIPQILDDVNPCNVRVWSLDVDTSDTPEYVTDRNPDLANETNGPVVAKDQTDGFKVSEIQFIE
ncbi:hypothetical protein [Phyllobacterium endophyticum]|uniref:hypothetical protein n=1 Tax=Phyllobacterium endophyticum TaxID=1149773 RepID=UPI0011C787A1|nr:hypothetical protein [Phyllobacterium endophyticum]TXR50764.1 hypothetical protein FVA77_02790 [Phyllobacterium endophyticum]